MIENKTVRFLPHMTSTRIIIHNNKKVKVFLPVPSTFSHFP